MGKTWRQAKAPLGAVGVKGKMWRPRPRQAAADDQGLAVIAIDREVEASVLEAPVVITAARGGELDDATAACLMDSLDGAPVGVKDAAGVVAVGKTWRPRQPAKAPPLKAVQVKDAKGVAVITRDGVKASEDGIAICRINALAEAPVITTTRHESVGVKDAKGVVAVGKMWRPRQPPAKAPPLKAVQVKDTQGDAVIAVDGKLESAAPVVAAARGWDKGPLEDVTAVFLMDSLDGAPVNNAMAPQEAVAGGVAVGKMWRPRRPAKAPLKAVGAKDAKAAAAIAVEGKVEASVLGALVVAADEGSEKRPLEKGIAGCQMDARGPVLAKTPQDAVRVKDAQEIAVGGEVKASVLGAPVVVVTEGGEKGPLEEGIVVCQVDTLDGAPVTTTTQQEAVGVKDVEEVAVGKMWRPQRPAKAPLEALGVKDAQGVAKITVVGEVELLAARGWEKGSVEDGTAVCQVDTLDGAPVTTTTQQEAVGVKDVEEVAVGKIWRPQRPAKAPLEALGVKDAQGVAKITVVGEVELLAARGGEKGSVEDGTAVCLMNSLDGAPVIATDHKEEVSAQGDPVLAAIDQKVDAPVVEGVQAITVKGNGKEEKDEGIKWLKHYSTAQSILIIGDGDFSFSLALATAFGSGGNLVATSLDSYELLTIKYDKAESNVRELKRLGATVLHGVDAETMKLHSYLEMRRFDRIVFNFPHAGFKGREHHLHVINAHKQLVLGFFTNARQLLRPYGEIHLSHKKGLHYDRWNIKKLAKKACLIMVRKVDFSREDYPGYNQKKGDGVTCDESFPLGPCCTFMFRARDVEKLKQQPHGNRVGSISSCLGDSKFYPGISATDMMWSFYLHPAWSQPHFPSVQMPIAFDPCPSGVAEMEDPFNCYGTTFHHQDMVQPTYQEQPWYQEGPPIEPPWTPQEHQSLQMEYEIHRQLTLSPEYPYMESVEEGCVSPTRVH